MLNGFKHPCIIDNVIEVLQKLTMNENRWWTWHILSLGIKKRQKTTATVWRELAWQVSSVRVVLCQCDTLGNMSEAKWYGNDRIAHFKTNMTHGGLSFRRFESNADFSNGNQWTMHSTKWRLWSSAKRALIYCHQLRFNNTASFCPPENGKWHWNVRHSQQWLPGTSQDLWIEIVHVVSNIASPKKGLAQNFQATAWYHGCTCCSLILMGCGLLWLKTPSPLQIRTPTPWICFGSVQYKHKGYSVTATATKRNNRLLFPQFITIPSSALEPASCKVSHSKVPTLPATLQVSGTIASPQKRHICK